MSAATLEARDCDCRNERTMFGQVAQVQAGGGHLGHLCSCLAMERNSDVDGWCRGWCGVLVVVWCLKKMRKRGEDEGKKKAAGSAVM